MTEISQLQKLQNNTARIVTGGSFDALGRPLIKKLGSNEAGPYKIQ